MSEKINFNDIKPNDLRFKDFDSRHTATHNELHMDVHRLHELTEGHPVEKVTLDSLEGDLHNACWTDSDGHRISPMSIVKIMHQEGVEEAKSTHPQLYNHIEKIINADRSYPLYVYEDIVIDGSHRLAQIYYNRLSGVSAQDFVTVKKLQSIPQAALISTEE